MSNSEAWAVVAGILLPLLVSLIKQADWPSKAKFALAVVLSLAAGAAASYFGGRLTIGWEWVLMDTAIVLAEATAIYKLFFEGGRVDTFLTNIGGPSV